jgi:LysM repeat protein
VIQSDDYCYLVESKFGITMTQLQAWNPALLADCPNLALGEAYCVNGASTSATATATATAAHKKRDSRSSPTEMPYTVAR